MSFAARFLTHTFPFVPPNISRFWKFLHVNPKHGFILGSGAASREDHVVYMSLEEPVSFLESKTKFGPDPLTIIENKISSLPQSSPFPRYVGFLGFEAGRSFDEGVKRQPTRPNPLKTSTQVFGEYHSVLKLDTRKQETTLFVAEGKGRAHFPCLVEKIRVAYARVMTAEKEGGWRFSQKKRTLSQMARRFEWQKYSHFEESVKVAKEAIRQGDIYQANLSIRFSGPFSGDAGQLYELLCERNPSPYACLIKTPKDWIVSCSPELLLQVTGEDLYTRPIAGTRPRGSSQKNDRVKEGQLLLSPKERAEHIMLVDLERNDLGRVARAGTVRVTDRFAIERYSHVMHIVSGVEGKLARGKNSLDALRAVFPGGTITGCPKIKSIEIIAALEKKARGPFYGSAGYVSWNGDAKWNILIRTALMKSKKITIQAGAGIVADSHPKREYREVLAKAQALLEASYDCLR